MNRFRCWAQLLLLATATMSVSAVAATQPLSEIRAAVEQFLRAQSPNAPGENRIEVGHIDSRLRLKRCSAPLAPFLPAGPWRAGNVTVGVRCPGRHPWTLYVSASVRRYATVVVASRALHRGLVIEAHDLELARRDTTDLRGGYFTRIADALSLRLRRTVPQGRPLVPAAVAKRIAVRKGQRVTLIAGDGALVVRSAGEALTDGSTGEVIRVRNARSQRIVDGVVVDNGMVRVRS